SHEVLGDTFSLIENDIIPTAAVPDILRSVAQHGCTPEEAAKKEGLEKLKESEIQAIIDELVQDNQELIEERGVGAMGPLMGKAMAKFQGKADGKLVNKLLREKIDN
ncbi:MAG: GatB/YqeY domain-containing protein, partial [Methanobacterium sp.]|nr:GatB/YqeY domain-containing protein [Methanobacterium sp.]